MRFKLPCLAPVILLALLAPAIGAAGAAFTPGNVVIYRVGDGAGSLVNTGNAVFLDEYTATGTLVQSIALPTAVSGANKQLIASGTATSEGLLTRSSDGRFLLLTGYARNLGGTGSLSGTTAAAVNRTAGRVDFNGTVDTSTALTDFADGNNPRGAISSDGTGLWVTGGAGGIRYAPLSSTTSTQLSTTVTNLRQPAIFNGQLYVSTSSGSTVRIGTVGTGLPTASGQTITNLPGFPTSGSPYSFVLLDLDSGVAGLDTLYVVDDGAGIMKYSLVSGNWTANGVIGTASDAYRGLAGTVSGGTVTLFATRKGGSGATGGGELVSLTDASGYNGSFSGTPVLLATAASNTAFRGVALAPQPAPCVLPDLTVSRTAPTTGTLGVPFDYTVTPSNSGTSAALGVVVQFTLPAGVTFNSAASASGFVPSQAGGVVTWTGGSLSAGGSVPLQVNVTPTATGDVTSAAGAAVIDPANTIAECNESNNTVTTPATTTISPAPNTQPTIQVASTTTPFLSLPATSPGYVGGVISDPTDPASVFGIDFTVADAETPAGSLIVTATSSNASVVPNGNLTLTGTGATRNLRIVPAGTGYSIITVTVSDGSLFATYAVNYAASAASVNPSTTRFMTGASDASTALAVDANYMFVADDENQVLRLHRRDQSGLPVKGFDYTSSLGLTDFSGGAPREVDIEASTRIGNRLFWLGSLSNASNGNARPNRNRLFATDLTGTGSAATLAYVGRYDGLRADLIAWDQNNGHGLGANYFGLAASAATGVIPEAPDGSGFNIEGLAIAPGTTTAYIGFRAPIAPAASRTKALIVPVTNITALVTGNPSAGPATFGAPIQLDLGGRGIRSIECNATYCLIIAGPAAAATGVAPNDFRLYSWTGNPSDAPVQRRTNLTALNSDGGFESIVELPATLTDSSQIQVLVDNGDTVYYGDGVIAKDLAQPNWKKWRSEIVTAPTTGSIAGRVWNDADGNGSQNTGETGLNGVSVELLDTLGTTLDTKTTAGDGNYSFINLAAGSYSVRTVAATVPAGMVATTPSTVLVTLTDGQAVTGIAFGYQLRADLSVSKVDTPDPVTAGSNITYTITVANAGPGAAANVSLSDALPAGTTFVSLNSPGGWNCSAPAVGSSGTVSCTLPSLGVTSAVFTLVAKVAPAVAGGTVISNTATVFSSTADPAGGNNSATAVTAVVGPPTITKSFSPATVLLNQPSTMTLTISNPAGNPIGLTGIGVTDPFPAGMQVAATPNATNSCGGTLTAGASGSSVSLTGGAIPAPGTACAVTVAVVATTNGTKTNVTGSVTSTEGGTGGVATATLQTTAPPAAVVSGGATICAGQSAALTAALTGASPWTVTWSDGFVQAVAASPATRTVSPSYDTTYTVTKLKDANYDNVTAGLTGQAVVTVKPTPSSVITSVSQVCSNSSGNAASVPDAGPGATYFWSVTGGSASSPTNGRSLTYTAGASGSVILTATVTLNGCSSSSSATLPIVQTPAAPVPAMPANGSTYQGGHLSWTHPGDASYDVYLDTVNPPQRLLMAGQVNNFDAAVPVWFPGVTYYWQVVARNACASASSSVQSFTAGRCAWTGQSPALLTPIANATNQGTTTTLRWTAVPGAARYDVFLGATSANMTLYLSIPVPQMSATVRLAGGKTYFWKVVATPVCGSNGTASSAVQSFTTATNGFTLTSLAPAYVNRWEGGKDLSLTGNGFLATSRVFTDHQGKAAGTLAPSVFTNSFSNSSNLIETLTPETRSLVGRYDVGVTNGGVEEGRLLQSLALRAFTDVTETDWFFESSGRIADAGVMEQDIDPSVTGPQFWPAATVTREQMAEYLARAYSWWRTRSTALTPAVCAAPDFADVPCSHPNWLAIHWIKMWGVTAGAPCTGGSGYCYSPNNNVTRAEMVTFLERLRQGTVLPGLLATVGQYDPGCSQAYPACAGWTDLPAFPSVQWPRGEFNVAYADRVTNGCGGILGSLSACPNDPVNRAQIATFLARLLGLVPTP